MYFVSLELAGDLKTLLIYFIHDSSNFLNTSLLIASTNVLSSKLDPLALGSFRQYSITLT